MVEVRIADETPFMDHQPREPQTDSLVELRLHRFHHHNGIIDHGSDGKHKREQGEQVDGESNHGHHGKCADDGNEDGYGRDKR